MEFTYDAYKTLLQVAKAGGYAFCGYHNYRAVPRALILRHDIDFLLEYALPFAEMEAAAGAVATYFVEVTSEFYNVMACTDKARLRRIAALGHTVGLHFDRTQYGADFSCFSSEYEAVVRHEVEVLQQALGQKVACYSFHEPLREEIEADHKIEGLVNAYAREFFTGFKYYSDSVMNWREDAVQGVRGGEYPRIQLLTHPFWYGKTAGDIRAMLLRFIGEGNIDRYRRVKSMCFYLDDYVKEEDVK